MSDKLSKRKSYVGKGEKDNSPTPQWFYDFIVRELGFVDVCKDPNEFNFFIHTHPEKSYCNPPFSNKRPFIEKACQEAKKGKLIVMLLPADFSTQWFVDAVWKCNATVVFIAGARLHSKKAIFPSMLLIFNNKREIYLVHINQLKEFLKKYLLGSELNLNSLKK